MPLVPFNIEASLRGSLWHNHHSSPIIKNDTLRELVLLINELMDVDAEVRAGYHQIDPRTTIAGFLTHVWKAYTGIG